MPLLSIPLGPRLRPALLVGLLAASPLPCAADGADRGAVPALGAAAAPTVPVAEPTGWTIGPTLRPLPQAPRPGTGLEDGPGSSDGSWENEERSEGTLLSGRPPGHRSTGSTGLASAPGGPRDARSPVGSALAAEGVGLRARSGHASSPPTGPPVLPV